MLRATTILAGGVLLTACGTAAHLTQTLPGKETPSTSTSAGHSCALGSLAIESTSSGVLMGTDTGIVVNLRNVSRSTCHIGGYLPVYSHGKLIPRGDNVVNVVAGDLSPGQIATFAVVNAYIQPQTASMSPCPKWPTARPAVTLDGRTIGHIAVVEDFCNKTFITPVGVQATSDSPTARTASYGAAQDEVVLIRLGAGAASLQAPCAT